MKTLTKTVGFAYPSSTHAVESGFAKTGCWVVTLEKRGLKHPRITLHSARATRDEAMQIASQLSVPWSFPMLHNYHELRN